MAQLEKRTKMWRQFGDNEKGDGIGNLEIDTLEV